MKFGFCIMADIDEIGFFPFIEGLGYDSAWVADSQMMYSDVYVVCAMAARETKRLRIGPGTAICGTRIPPVQVAAMATLNRMAPGRVFLGIGTGNTAMRTMGQKPMKIAAFGEYLRVMRGLLDGEVVDYAFEGRTRPVKMLRHETRFMNLQPRIPVYVSGFGPRAMALAGEYGDGLVFAIPPRGLPVQDALAHVRQGAARNGRDMSRFQERDTDERCGVATGGGGGLRSSEANGRAECDGERLLLLRHGSGDGDGAPGLPAAHLEAVLRPG